VVAARWVPDGALHGRVPLARPGRYHHGIIRIELGSTQVAEEEDTQRYRAVVNDEEQYSIWLAHRDLPAGWYDTGVEGTKDECLAYIETAWTDMRPKSLRMTLEAAE
jgi:MbtH protein